jgi:hypothetical protein
MKHMLLKVHLGRNTILRRYKAILLATIHFISINTIKLRLKVICESKTISEQPGDYCCSLIIPQFLHQVPPDILFS